MFGESEPIGRDDLGRFGQWAHLLAFAGDESGPKAGPFCTGNVASVGCNKHALAWCDTHFASSPAVDSAMGLELAWLFHAQHALG